MILEKQHIDFEQIYLSYFSKMKRFAREYVLSDEDAENIVQDVFLDFWEKKRTIAITYQYPGLFIYFYKKPMHRLSPT